MSLSYWNQTSTTLSLNVTLSVVEGCLKYCFFNLFLNYIKKKLVNVTIQF